jgi:hypothetical protein
MNKSDLEKLKKLREEIFESLDKEDKPTEETPKTKPKPKGKKEMDAETKAQVLERLRLGREKANGKKREEKQIKDKIKQEKLEEFEKLKEKYLKPKTDEPPKTPKIVKETHIKPEEEKKEEVKPEPKPEVKPEPPKPQEPVKVVEEVRQYYSPTMKYLKRHNLLY